MLFDDLVRPRQHIRRNREADLLGRFPVEYEIELGGWFLLASSAILFLYLKNPPVLTVTSAFTRSLTAARNAPSKSGLELRTSNESRGIFSVRAAVSYSWKPVRSGALGVAQRTPTRDTPGTASLSNSSRFPLRARVNKVSPVTF